MPPKGRPYTYSRDKVRTEVPTSAGVYWLWSFGELVRIGQSTNLQRRILDYSDKDPNKFRYQTVSEYFRRRDPITRPPTTSVDTLTDKIEHTEFAWYKEKHGRLPRWNKQDKHYDVGLFEQLLSKVL
jgi:hypothetical protein